MTKDSDEQVQAISDAFNGTEIDPLPLLTEPTEEAMGDFFNAINELSQALGGVFDAKHAKFRASIEIVWDGGVPQMKAGVQLAEGAIAIPNTQLILPGS